VPAPVVICPRRGHRPPQPLGATDACPGCGVHMHKWQQRMTAAAVALQKKPDAAADADDGCWRTSLLTLPGKEAGDPVFIASLYLVLKVGLTCMTLRLP